MQTLSIEVLLTMSSCNPPASEESTEVANFTEQKNIHPLYGAIHELRRADFSNFLPPPTMRDIS